MTKNCKSQKTTAKQSYSHQKNIPNTGTHWFARFFHIWFFLALLSNKQVPEPRTRHQEWAFKNAYSAFGNGAPSHIW